MIAWWRAHLFIRFWLSGDVLDGNWWFIFNFFDCYCNFLIYYLAESFFCWISILFFKIRTAHIFIPTNTLWVEYFINHASWQAVLKFNAEPCDLEMLGAGKQVFWKDELAWFSVITSAMSHFRKFQHYVFLRWLFNLTTSHCGGGSLPPTSLEKRDIGGW